MEKVKINIGDKTYNCQIAKTEEEKKKGLLDLEFLPVDEGMLFIWDEEGDRSMHMKDMKFPIDLIGINEDDEVNLVYSALPTEDMKMVTFPHAKYILEVNVDSGIKEGDEFEMDDSDDLNKYVMKILAPDGSTQMLLQSGERIFSRKSTRQLIKWAKKALSAKDNEEQYLKYCKRLGKRMFREIKALNTRPAEYVDVPNNENSNDKN